MKMTLKIIPTDEARDLGITISNEGNFNKHIDGIIKKVNQKSGWILRYFQSREYDTLRFC